MEAYSLRPVPIPWKNQYNMLIEGMIAPELTSLFMRYTIVSVD